jgi:hypothetical protein
MNVEPYEHALYFQSEVQRLLFTGLYLQGSNRRQPNAMQCSASNANRRTGEQLTYLVRLHMQEMMSELGQPINAPRYAGPFKE